MNAPTLFDPAPLQVGNTETQGQAEVTRDRRLDRERVRALFLEREDWTDWELADRLGEPLRKATFGKRRQELGAVPVMRDGKPLTRVCHGSSMTVWRLP